MVVATRQDNINCMLHGQFVWHIPLKNHWSLLVTIMNIMCEWSQIRLFDMISLGKHESKHLKKKKKHHNHHTHAKYLEKNEKKVSFPKFMEQKQQKNENSLKNPSEFLTLVDMFFRLFPTRCVTRCVSFADATALNRLRPLKKKCLKLSSFK